MSRFVFAGESDDYRRRREELLAAEIALKDQVERVAEMRRALPPGRRVPDYVFREGATDLGQNDPVDVADVALADLFTDGHDTLIVDPLMFGAGDDEPCVMCSMWADGYNAVAPHIMQRASFVLVAKAESRTTAVSTPILPSGICSISCLGGAATGTRPTATCSAINTCMRIGPIEAALVRQQFACLHHQNGPKKLELFMVSALASCCMKAGLSFLRCSIAGFQSDRQGRSGHQQCYAVAWCNAYTITILLEDATLRY